MIPYSKQSIDEKDIKGVMRVLRSDFITQGPKTREFENALAKYCGAKYAVSVSSGTAALHLAYLVLGLKKGDEVITTPNTFVATANMLVAVGAKPVFSDIRLDTFNMDEKTVERLITSKTRALVPVHFAGQPCEMKIISAIARKRGLRVIEDACHAFGAGYRGSRIGNCKYSDMTVFRFHPVKSITTGEGGAILTNNEKFYKYLLLLKNHGIHKDKAGKNVMTIIGYNYRMTDIQAALGVSQMVRADYFIRKRNQIAEWYKEFLGKSPYILLPALLSGNYSSWHIYVIRVKNSKYRDNLVAFLKKNGVGANFQYQTPERR